MPRRKEDQSAPFLRLATFTNEQHQELRAKSLVALPVYYKNQHVSDCVFDLGVARLLLSLLDSQDGHLILGAMNYARPPRIAIKLPIAQQECSPAIRALLGDESTSARFEYSYLQVPAQRIVLFLATRLGELTNYFEGTETEPKFPLTDIERSLNFISELEKLPSVKMQNGNCHDLRFRNLDASIKHHSMRRKQKLETIRNARKSFIESSVAAVDDKQLKEMIEEQKAKLAELQALAENPDAFLHHDLEIPSKIEQASTPPVAPQVDRVSMLERTAASTVRPSQLSATERYEHDLPKAFRVPLEKAKPGSVEVISTSGEEAGIPDFSQLPAALPAKLAELRSNATDLTSCDEHPVQQDAEP